VGSLQEKKIENPMKRIACHLAHQMDDERRMYFISMPEWKMDEIKECGKQLRDDIGHKGYDIQTILHYVEEYKKLSMKDYMEWRFI